MTQPTYKTMAEAVQGLRNRGFTSNFEHRDRALCEIGSGRTFQPEEVTIVEPHRFEGASDPDDLSVIYAVEGPDRTRGLLMDAFGVYANPHLGEFLTRVKVHETL